jgi:uncharacterized protein YdaU (DUF1376 family)
MSDAPFVNFYTSDFLGGTSGMTAATKGVYITLLCLMYEAEKPLGQSRDAIARRCGCTVPAFEKALAALIEDGKVEVGPDGIWSQKCEKHIASRRERRNSAKAAAEKRWQKSEQKQSKADAAASIPQCKPEPEPEIYTEAIASDAKSVLWTRGVAYLVRQGSTERNARAFVGKCLSQAAPEKVRDAFNAALEAATHDPIPYIIAALKPKAAPQDAIWSEIMQEKAAS